MLSDLSGRHIVITGATSGVGHALARVLAARGAHVILAARDARARESAVDALRETGASASGVALDLSDLGSVRRAAEEIGQRPIDTLVNNAAVAGARGATREGFELAFGTNHLGHYLLTRLLLPVITRRVVHLGSGAHASARDIDWDACTRPTGSLTGIHEYAVSKLAVARFHHELARRTHGRAGPVSVLADPGNVASRAYRHVPTPFRQLWTWGMKSPDEGARAPLHCVMGDVLAGASYLEDRAFTPSPESRSAERARELWARSARWVGLDEDL